MRLVILGLSITSSWGNGHAVTYRGLVEALAHAGHDVLFLERDVPWYAANRDLPQPPYGRTALYADPADLRERFTAAVREADAVIVGSYVPDGIAIADWVLSTARGVTAFYDIDTPVTLEALSTGTCAYLSTAQIPAYHIYFSFTGGRILHALERDYGARRALPLYCSVNPQQYAPPDHAVTPRWDLGYMGTYSPDRQPALDRLLLNAARSWPDGRFVVAGPQYPAEILWPPNVEQIDHLPPPQHPAFYHQQRLTLNITRAAMVAWGWSPSIRLFEAAACGVPILSDVWDGIADFFTPGEEILLAETTADALTALRDLPADLLHRIGRQARERVLAAHTPRHRAAALITALETTPTPSTHPALAQE